MFSENLKTLRKQKGLTQETLAIKLHITRQTISKWEKGLSVPDTEQLVRLAEVLEVPITQLLGQKVADTTNENEVAEYLAQIAEQLAIKNRRTKLIVKIVVGILVAFVVANLLMVLMSFSSFKLPYGSRFGSSALGRGQAKILLHYSLLLIHSKNPR